MAEHQIMRSTRSNAAGMSVLLWDISAGISWRHAPGAARAVPKKVFAFWISLTNAMTWVLGRESKRETTRRPTPPVAPVTSTALRGAVEVGGAPRRVMRASSLLLLVDCIGGVSMDETILKGAAMILPGLGGGLKNKTVCRNRPKSQG